MNEYPIYADDGKLFCKCRYQDGGVILRTKNSEIFFHSLAERLSHRQEMMEVREKSATPYGKTKHKNH